MCFCVVVFLVAQILRSGSLSFIRRLITGENNFKQRRLVQMHSNKHHRLHKWYHIYSWGYASFYINLWYVFAYLLTWSMKAKTFSSSCSNVERTAPWLLGFYFFFISFQISLVRCCVCVSALSLTAWKYRKKNSN